MSYSRLLSGSKIVDEKSALQCIRQIHAKFHVPTVIVSSTNITCSATSAGPDPDAVQGLMLGYASRLVTSRQHDGDSLSTEPGGGPLDGQASGEWLNLL